MNIDAVSRLSEIRGAFRDRFDGLDGRIDTMDSKLDLIPYSLSVLQSIERSLEASALPNSPPNKDSNQ